MKWSRKRLNCKEGILESGAAIRSGFYDEFSPCSNSRSSNLKKIVIALVVLVVLLVGAVLLGPSFIDWNSYKGQIVAAIQDKTGRGAAIDGDIAFSILPTPALRVAGLRIANFEGAQAADMLRLKELRVRVSIGPLLERRVVVEQLELVEPHIVFEVAEDGQASWDIEMAGVKESGVGSSKSATRIRQREFIYKILREKRV